MINIILLNKRRVAIEDPCLIKLIDKIRNIKIGKLDRNNLILVIEMLGLDQNWKKALYILLKGKSIKYISRSYVLEKCEKLVSLCLEGREIEILDYILQKRYKDLF